MKNQLDRLILLFASLKLLIHFLTNTNYNFHRDEYLYLDQGNHLGWGFMEVPPITPLIGKVATMLGGGVFITRFFPALVGAITIFLAGHLVKKLGGKQWAIIFSCGGLLLSPALLGSNTLFQPVSFNQFFWFLSAYLLVQAIHSEKSKYWYWLGISVGVGFLTKYSIVFYGIGIVFGMLLTPQRKWLITKYPYIALGISLLIASPNLFWQHQHNLPVVAHMQELSESQLVHINWGDFLLSQFRFHLAFSIIWIVGLISLFRLENFRPYRFLGIGFLFTILLIGGLSGKPYYTIGAFTILFPFGGVALEKWIVQKSLRILLALIIVLLSIPTILYNTPIFKIDQMKKYCSFMAENYDVTGPLRWEDGNYYELPQDYADMHGWEELTRKVANVYHSLSVEEQKNCMIYGGSYGHTCSINYYREKYNLPEAYSFSSSCLMWAPEEIKFNNQIMIDDRLSLESQWFNEIELRDSIENPFARDPGFILYRKNPKINVSERWKELVTEAKKEFNL